MVSGENEVREAEGPKPHDIYEEEEPKINRRKEDVSQPGVIKPVKKKANDHIVIDAEENHPEQHVESLFPFSLAELET